jgi:D-beta-D-heptose 7-phosphate kinase/D-beta-D-heptose 1-phosphate adenosyltransferase
LDEEQLSPPTEAEQAALASQIEAGLGDADLLVVSDYDKGLLSPGLAERIQGLADDRCCRIVADLKPANALTWRHLDLITPNWSEARSLCALLDAGREPSEEAESIADTLRRRLGCAVVLKMGGRGMLVAPTSGSTRRLEALCRSPVEVSGAGDTVLATLAAALARGSDLHQAAWLANLAASISVSKPGTHAVSAAELEDVLTQSAESSP